MREGEREGDGGGEGERLGAHLRQSKRREVIRLRAGCTSGMEMIKDGLGMKDEVKTLRGSTACCCPRSRLRASDAGGKKWHRAAR